MVRDCCAAKVQKTHDGGSQCCKEDIALAYARL
jgi:hypothetical protein